MKKFSMALLVAFLGAGVVTACGGDDKNSCEDEKSACDAIANADGVHAGEDCKCTYTCKPGYHKVEASDGTGLFTCQPDDNTCAEVCTGIMIPEGVECKGELDASKTKCSPVFSCVAGYRNANGSTNSDIECVEDNDSCDNSVCTSVPDNGAECRGVKDESVAGGCKAVYSCGEGYRNDNGSEGPDIECVHTTPCDNQTCAVALPYECVKTVNGTACDISYKCASPYEKVTEGVDPTNDDFIAYGFLCLLPNGEICQGNDECISGNCETIDEDTMKCAEKDNGGGETGQACGSDGDEPCPVDSQCISGHCKAADDIIHTSCSPDSSQDYCFGNMKVYCLEGNDGNAQYSYENCDEDATCTVEGLTARCVLNAPVDPTVCSAATEGNVAYSCGGDEDEENWGGYKKSIAKTCTNNSGTYEWVESSINCASYESCYPKHAAKRCTTGSPLDYAIGRECYNNDLNCASDYCDPSTNLCAERP